MLASLVQKSAERWLYKKKTIPYVSVSNSDAGGFFKVKMQRLFHMKQFVGISLTFRSTSEVHNTAKLQPY